MALLSGAVCREGGQCLSISTKRFFSSQRQSIKLLVPYSDYSLQSLPNNTRRISLSFSLLRVIWKYTNFFRSRLLQAHVDSFDSLRLRLVLSTCVCGVWD